MVFMNTFSCLDTNGTVGVGSIIFAETNAAGAKVNPFYILKNKLPKIPPDSQHSPCLLERTPIQPSKHPLPNQHDHAF